MTTREIHHTRTGSGSPLVLVHGLGGTGLVWAPVVDRLASERDVIVVDLPGFGRSSPLPGATRPTAQNLAGPLAGLFAELGVERPHVAGNSLGGWVCLELAKAGAAASVCAISPAGLWREPPAPRRVERQRLGRWLRPVLSLALISPRGRTALLRSNMARPERVPPDVARSLVLGYLRSPGYVEASAEMRAGAFEGRERVEVPVTVAWGMEDRRVGRPSRSRLPPNARYVEMEGWGHVPTWDDPEGVARLLLEASAPGLGSAAAEAQKST